MNSSPATPPREGSAPWIEPPLANRIAAIEELVASRYWGLLPLQAQNNWRRQLNDLRGQLTALPCNLPGAPPVCL